ncbi:MAG: low temperature requirement protein A [Mycoplasmatales bacterium]
MIKRYFKRPTLLGVGNTLPERSATPLELFFDLAFVIALAHLVIILEHDMTYQSLVYIILKFIALFLYWIMITKYNQYFEDHTPIHKLIILLSMIPIIFLTIGGDITNLYLYRLYTESFVVSRLFIILLWFWGSYKVQNNYLKKIVKVNYITSINSIVVVLLGFSFILADRILVWLIIWSYVLGFEIVYPLYKLTKINQGIDFSKPNIPIFDRKLQVERATLFVILILGEGLVGVSALVNHLESGKIIDATALLVTTFLLFWIFTDYYASHTVKLEYTLKLNYLNLFQTLANFLIIISIVIMFEHHNKFTQLILGIGLILHALTNIILHNNKDEFIYEKYHYKTKDVKYEVKHDIVQKSFILNIIMGILLLFIELSISNLIILINLILFVNVILIIRGSLYLKINTK